MFKMPNIYIYKYMKYVCIGQPKTGTKTIAEIFRLLMLNVNNNPIRIMKDILLNGAEIFASKKQKTTPIMNKRTF